MQGDLLSKIFDKTKTEVEERKAARDQFIAKSKMLNRCPLFRSAVKEFHIKNKFVIAMGQSSVVLCDSIFGVNYGHLFL